MPRHTFLITGVGKGLGRAIAEVALASGHTVVGTVRSGADAIAFDALHADFAHARKLDVTDDDAVFATVEAVEREIGAIDVVIANAGYGLEGPLEEISMADIRRQFDVNVFGAVAVIKAVLPHMRARRAGHIFGMTSMGGLITFAGTAAYHGSKFALEGILGSLGKEVKQFGIHVTSIEPGSFRTDWAGSSLARSDRSISDYDELFEPIREQRRSISGNQLGNPTKLGAAVLEVLDTPDPPAHLLLGSDALRLVAVGRTALDEDIHTWEKLSHSTDFPEGAALG
jgi:NAD(P)-dependent dehydrogenase (short-subunit alcohol dehydrogenase family)